MLRLVADLIERKGFAPTMQELADLLHISKAAVHDRVEAIIDAGHMDKPPGQLRRSLVITQAGRAWLESHQSRNPNKRIDRIESPPRSA